MLVEVLRGSAREVVGAGVAAAIVLAGIGLATTAPAGAKLVAPTPRPRFLLRFQGFLPFHHPDPLLLLLPLLKLGRQKEAARKLAAVL